MARQNQSSANWDDPELFREVAVGLYHALDTTNGLTPKVKDGFVKFLATQGHVVTWNAFRQHIQKLRKKRDTTAIDDAENADNEAANTKGKAKSKAGSRKRAAPKATQAKKEDELKDEDENYGFDDLIGVKSEPSDLYDQPPAKRVKYESSPLADDSAAGDDQI